MVLSNLYKSRWAIDKCVLLLLLCEKRLWDKRATFLEPYLKEIIERMSGLHRIMLHAQAKQDTTVEGCPGKVSESSD